jgi:hypothetical protein
MRYAAPLFLVFLCTWGQKQLTGLYRVTEESRYGKQELLFSRETKQGKLQLTELNGQRTLYLDYTSIATMNDMHHAEELAAGLLAHQTGKRVSYFIVSPQYRNIAKILDTPGTENTFIVCSESRELSGLLSALDTSEAPPGIRELFGDPRNVLARQPVRFDGIVWDLPHGANIQKNRYATLECMKSIKERLAKDGILVLSAEAADDYIGPELAAVLASLWTTLGELFDNRLVYPGQNWIFISRNGPAPLLTDHDSLASALQLSGAPLIFWTRGFLPYRLSKQKQAKAYELLKNTAGTINNDFHPQVAARFYRLWSAYNLKHLRSAGFLFSPGMAVKITLFLALACIAVFSSIRSMTRHTGWAPYLSVFVLSFSAMGLYWLLLVCLQIVSGNLYHILALGISLFMLGTSAGTYLGNRTNPQTYWLPGIHGSALVTIFVLYKVVTAGTTEMDYPALGFLIGSGIVITGLITGFMFPLFAYNTPTTGRLWMYSLDLFGGCLAAFWISFIAVPCWGFGTSLLLLFILNAVPLVGTGWKQINQ